MEVGVGAAGDPMGDVFGGPEPMGGPAMDTAEVGAPDAAMAAMDGAQAANMAEGMDAANAGAEADAASVADAPAETANDDIA
jgi:hypothetical protein